MDRNSLINTIMAIFISIAVIISLFPPFEFGNEMLRGLNHNAIAYYSNTKNGSIFISFPIKEYDFIFNSNKKYFHLKNEWYVLRRELISSELFIEYFLAFLVSIFIGFVIYKLKIRIEKVEN